MRRPRRSAPPILRVRTSFEFVEFAHPEPDKLDVLFLQMGYAEVARHKTKAISVCRQGRINYLLNREPRSHASRFVAEHGPCAPAMAWGVVDADHTLKRAVGLGAKEYTARGSLPGRSRPRRHRRVATLPRRYLRRQGIALCERIRVAGRRPIHQPRRWLSIHRSSDAQCRARQHGHLVPVLSRHFRLPPDPLLQHRG